jgi:hypothetical protein
VHQFFSRSVKLLSGPCNDEDGAISEFMSISVYMELRARLPTIANCMEWSHSEARSASQKLRVNFYVTRSFIVSWDSSVSIVSATGWTTGRSRFDSRQRIKDFSCSLCVQSGCGAHPASCTMGTGGPFPGDKARPGRDADHSPPSSAEVMNEYELYLLSPKAPSWRVVGQLYFYFS